MCALLIRTPGGVRISKALTTALVAAAVGALPLACNDDNGGTTNPGPPPSQITVSMVDNAFQQKTDTVAVNGTVTWRNDGANNHTTTSDATGWDSNAVAPGGTFSHQFTQAGSFPYHCKFHGGVGTGMSGTIVVR
jgi:plastocyanin